jgi:hypothetical protein
MIDREETMTRFAIVALSAFCVVFGAGSAALAQTSSCNTTMSGTIPGNLVVPTGTTCTLNGARVAGNVLVEKSATLNVGTGSKIRGNIEAEQCNFVFLFGNPISVGGNVRIDSCGGGQDGYQADNGPPPGIRIDGNFFCENNAVGCLITGGEVGGNARFINNEVSQIFGPTIGGNLVVNDNSAPLPGAEAAVVVSGTIGGNVEVNGNSAPQGSVIVGGNKIGGNLRCRGNTPGVTDDGVGPNAVGGKRQGQCAGLSKTVSSSEAQSD